MEDCIVVCIWVVCAVIAFFAASRIFMDVALQMKDQPDHGRLKIPADCPKTEHDFIVDLECPDGGVARVAIPIDSNSRKGECSRVFSLCDPPVGLNLVCPGHYT